MRVSAHRHAVLAGELRTNRRFLREQVRRLFAREMGRSGESPLAALDALCSFETWDLLRADQGLSRQRAETALVDALERLLR
jgi:hypothetical protein